MDFPATGWERLGLSFLFVIINFVFGIIYGFVEIIIPNAEKRLRLILSSGIFVVNFTISVLLFALFPSSLFNPVLLFVIAILTTLSGFIGWGLITFINYLAKKVIGIFR